MLRQHMLRQHMLQVLYRMLQCAAATKSVGGKEVLRQTQPMLASLSMLSGCKY